MESTEDEGILRTRFGHHAAAGFLSALAIRILALVFVKVLQESLWNSSS